MQLILVVLVRQCSQAPNPLKGIRKAWDSEVLNFHDSPQMAEMTFLIGWIILFMCITNFSLLVIYQGILHYFHNWTSSCLVSVSVPCSIMKTWRIKKKITMSSTLCRNRPTIDFISIIHFFSGVHMCASLIQ